MNWEQNVEFNRGAIALQPRERVWVKTGGTVFFLEIVSVDNSGSVFGGHVVAAVPVSKAPDDLSFACWAEFETRNVSKRLT